MVSLPRPPATSLLRVLFLGLSTLASPSQAQLELHVPSGLTRLKAVEGSEVVLPAWYTVQGQVSSSQRWELLTVMWFLEQEGKDLNQVREGSISARGYELWLSWGRSGQSGRVGQGWGTGKKYSGKSKVLLTSSVFVLT
ncbi:unnamed protein product, partial [Gulo gulo]